MKTKERLLMNYFEYSTPFGVKQYNIASAKPIPKSEHKFMASRQGWFVKDANLVRHFSAPYSYLNY